MKKGFVVFVHLALLFVLGAPLFSQPSEKSVETILIDNFDTPDKMEWTWKIQASRFVADGYPALATFKGISNSLRPFVRDGDPEPQVLGAKVAYTRKGDNWFEIYPTKEGVPYEIPFIGRVSQIDFWVWGSQYLYFMDILVRDSDGSVHVIPCGNLAFGGWKNLVISIPTSIRQKSRLHTGPETMNFVGFRIHADANEFADDYSIFFDKLQYTTSVMDNVYDGYDLRSAEFGKEGQ